MEKTEVQNGALIALYDNETDKYIQSYWASDFSEHLKIFDFAMKNDIELVIKSENEKLDDTVAMIENIFINFGDNVNLTSIRVYATLLK